MHNKIYLDNKHAIGPAHKISTQINHPIVRVNLSNIILSGNKGSVPLQGSPFEQ